MSRAEIREVIDAWAAAAVRLKKGGYDGCDIPLYGGHLLENFISPLANTRPTSTRQPRQPAAAAAPGPARGARAWAATYRRRCAQQAIMKSAAHRLAHRAQDLARQPQPVVEAAAVLVGPRVGERGDEVLEQVAAVERMSQPS